MYSRFLGFILKFISYNSPAKINLFLYITGKRDDGFHELFSLVQQIDLMDIIQIKPSNHFELSVNGPEIHGENIIVKAKKALENYLKRAINLEVILSKRIPIGSGLGGGSSNAATFLKAANNILKLGLQSKQLMDIGTTVGSDVPMFFSDHGALISGRGEVIKSVNLPTDYWILLIVPDFSIDTTWAYAQVKEYDQPPDILMNESFDDHDRFWELIGSFKNSFEPILTSHYPEVYNDIKKLRHLGAEFASITGSGAAYYGIFQDLTVILSAASENWHGKVFLLRPLKVTNTVIENNP